MDSYIYKLPPRVNYEDVEEKSRPLKRTIKSYDLLDLEPQDKKYKNDNKNINDIENKLINDFSNKISNIEIFKECLCPECRR